MSQNSSRNRSLPLFITLFILSLILNVFLFVKYAKNGAKIQEQNKELTAAYKLAKLEADSLQNELDFTIQQLQDKINENLAQEDLKENIRQQLEAKQAELYTAKRKISRLIAGGSGSGSSSGGPRTLAAAKNEINSLKKKNEEFIKKAEDAQLEYERTNEELKYASGKAKQYKIVNDSLVEVTDYLNKKLETASTLRIAGLNVSPIRERKGAQERTDKASKVERLKISFSMLASELTIKENKDLTIRIIAPNGVVLSKDTEKLMDKEDVFSLQNTVTYDGTEKGVTYYYDQEEEYESGNYKVELLSDGNILDRSSFSLR